MNKNKTKTRKKVLYPLLSIILLIVALYFTITSSFFLTKAVIPTIGYLMDARFVAGHATYNPFTSYLEVHDVTLGDKDNPFIIAKSAYGYVNLLALFKMTLNFSDIYIDGIDINFIKGKKKKWSIPWLYANILPEDLVQIKLDFPNVNVKNLNLKYSDESTNDPNPLTIELKNVNFKSKHFENGLFSLIKYKGDLRINSGKTVGIDKGNVKGELSVNLDSWCVPSHVKISTLITNMGGKIRNSKIAEENLDFGTEIKRQGNDPCKYNI